MVTRGRWVGWNDYLVGMGFFWGDENQKEVMGAQYHACTKGYWIVHLKVVNLNMRYMSFTSIFKKGEHRSRSSFSKILSILHPKVELNLRQLFRAFLWLLSLKAHPIKIHWKITHQLPRNNYFISCRTLWERYRPLYPCKEIEVVPLQKTSFPLMCREDSLFFQSC